ncbi:hypothetical protein ACOMHN_063615 [Nucella lapillus]
MTEGSTGHGGALLKDGFTHNSPTRQGGTGRKVGRSWRGGGITVGWVGALLDGEKEGGGHQLGSIGGDYCQTLKIVHSKEIFLIYGYRPADRKGYIIRGQAGRLILGTIDIGLEFRTGQLQRPSQ